MTYDAADGYVLLFSGASRDDTWTFANGVWTKLSPSLSPPERDAASLAYDPHDGYVVLFGGAGKSQPGYLNTTNFRQTWTFVHGVWTNITPTTLTVSNSPSSRSGASFAYDARDGYLVLFGGDSRRTFLNDTWSFVDGQWTNITSTAGTPPSCRFGGGMVDDPAEGYLLLFGGVSKRGGGADGCGANVLNGSAEGTWSFAGGKWTELAPSTSPPITWNLGMAYDAADGSVVLFGGIGPGDVAMQETWTYAGGDWSLVSAPNFPPISPPARFSASMAYDAKDGYVLMYGGLSQPENHAPILGDVWAYRGSVWENLTPNPIPSFRSSMAMTYDAEDGCVLLFGGLGPSGPLSDTWRYVAGTWVELTPSVSPPARYDASMTYDANPLDQYVLLFGGVGTSGDLGDTWSFARDVWTNLTSTNSSVSPSPRIDSAMAYDAASGVQKVVLFGGQSPGGVLGDTWLFVNGSWSPDSASSAPPARASASLAYDTAAGDDYLVLFGGVNGSDVYGDTWEFTSQAQWTEISAGNASSPAPRYAAGLVFDTDLGYLLLFGGTNGVSLWSDTWVYLHGTWERLSPVTSPPGRLTAGFAFDAADGFAFLFSGGASVSETSVVRTDLWAFASGDWTNITAEQIRLPPLPASSSLGSNFPELLLIAGGIAVAAVIAVVFWSRRRRSAVNPGPTSAPEGSATASPELFGSTSSEEDSKPVS